MILNPEDRIKVDHSVGAVLDEDDAVLINLLPMALNITYNVFYGDVLNMPMFKGSEFHSDNIHGSAVLKLLSNSADIFTEEVRLLDVTDEVKQCIGLPLIGELKPDEAEFLDEAEETLLDLTEAILFSLPYVPALRQFMHVKGNGLSVVLLDPFTLMVTAHGVKSTYFLENEHV